MVPGQTVLRLASGKLKLDPENTFFFGWKLDFQPLSARVYVNLVGGSRGEKRPEFGGPFDIAQVVKNNILLDISYEQMGAIYKKW